MNPEFENILRRVKDMYLRYGIKSVTMDDIARELGVSKKTLYSYVQDKNDLVDHVFRMETRCRQEQFSGIFKKGLNAIEEVMDVHKYVNNLLREHNPSVEYDLKKYHPEIHHQYHAARQKKMYDTVLNNLKKGKEEGLYRSDLDEEIIAKLQVARYISMFDSEMINIDDLISKKFIREVFIFFIRGIASEKGIHVLEKKMEELNTE